MGLTLSPSSQVKKVTSGGRDVSGVAELESSGAGPCVQAPWAACSVFSPPHCHHLVDVHTLLFPQGLLARDHRLWATD